MKICSQCNIEKELDEYHKKGDSTRPNCKMCVLSNNKLYRKNNKAKIKEIKKTYYATDEGKKCLRDCSKRYSEKHKDEIRERNRETHRIYCNNRYKNDIIYRLTVSVRTLISKSFRNKYKKPKKSINILGCTIENFRLHIENQFVEGMTWDNHGEWHLDHIKPISWAKTEDEVVEYNHYLNFKPMWAIDNIKKGNRYAG